MDPRQSSVFGSYAPDDDTTVLALEDLEMYKEDWIGLRCDTYSRSHPPSGDISLCVARHCDRELHETDRLHRFSVPCYHGDYYSSCYGEAVNKYVLPFLMGTWNGTVPGGDHDESEHTIEPSPDAAGPRLDLGFFPQVFRE